MKITSFCPALPALLLAACWTLPGTAVRADEDRDRDHEEEELERREHPEPERNENGPSGRTVLAFAEEKLPEAFADYQALLREAPEEAGEVLEFITDVYLTYRAEQEEDPEYADLMLRIERLEIQTFQLADRLRQQPQGSDREANADKLRHHLVETFELKMVLQEREVKFLAEELEEARARLEKRAANRERIIQRRYEELMDEQDEALSW